MTDVEHKILKLTTMIKKHEDMSDIRLMKMAIRLENTEPDLIAFQKLYKLLIEQILEEKILRGRILDVLDIKTEVEVEYIEEEIFGNDNILKLESCR